MIGAKHSALARDNGVFNAVSRCKLDHLQPARLDNDLHIRPHITALGDASMWGKKIVHCETNPARVTVRFARIGPTGRAVGFPVALRVAFERFHAADPLLAREGA